MSVPLGRSERAETSWAPALRVGHHGCTGVSRPAIGSDLTLSVTLIPSALSAVLTHPSVTSFGHTTWDTGGGLANRTPTARPAVSAWRTPANRASTTSPDLFASI